MGNGVSDLLKEIAKDPAKHEKNMKQLFDKLDKNKDGVLDANEAKVFFEDLHVITPNCSYPVAGWTTLVLSTLVLWTTSRNM